MGFKLVFPELEMESSFNDYINEFKNSGEKIVPGFINQLDKDYKTRLNYVLSFQKKETCPSDLVTASSYFMINDFG